MKLDRDEGDLAYFYALTLQLEYLTKLVTAAVVACIGDDADRHRYTLEHRLVRANSIGDWPETLNLALTGPAAQFFQPGAYDIVRDLTERVSSSDDRYGAIDHLRHAAEELDLKPEIGRKAALRQFFTLAARVRNRTRGHGATTAQQATAVCPNIAEAIAAITGSLRLFKVDWAYLHRNLSGKYRVVPLIGKCNELQYLKRTRDIRFPNGVFVILDSPVFVPLVFSDPNLLDVFLPNGDFRSGDFETLSYITNSLRRQDGQRWMDPAARLPGSQTEGGEGLDPIGEMFANLPPLGDYIARPLLQETLRSELLTTDRHALITLTGPGGIGKTTLALAALHEVAQQERAPYDVILWISARDIDLLESGPKPVSPRVSTLADIARLATDLLRPFVEVPKMNGERYLAECLAKDKVGRVLLVLDNFETLQNPADVFRWLDTHVRPPNKILITTRFRDFVGDYPIRVAGMTDDEAHALINREASRLEIEPLLEAGYKETVIQESEGHPYVIKILLGQVASERRAVKPRRIVANADQLLSAMFERTYSSLTPAAQRVFLLLSRWRAVVPEVAVEAVLLRPGNERFDVAEALNELRRFSLVEELGSESEEERFVAVPLAATMYGRRKLESSPFRATVEEDRKVLMEFGAGRESDVSRGVLPRIRNLVKAIAKRAANDPAGLQNAIPVLEYLASRVPHTYLELADLVVEAGWDKRGHERAKDYLRRFIETAPPPERWKAWMRVADLCAVTEDVVGEVQALSEAALLPVTKIGELEDIANRINSRTREARGRRFEQGWSAEIRVLLLRVIEVMERQLSDLSPSGCSRLAWLHVKSGNPERALDIARFGLTKDKTHLHCLNLVHKLDS
ncbi:MAG: hypothetical protein F4Z04_17320 [Acidobacteria bacterium]|nr:hypothetical protein [Acidobacteriota bacterium]